MSDKRILGKRLGQRIGQDVIVLGRVTEKSSDGMSAEITTTDDAHINVTFPEPLDSDASDYIEVRGTVKSKSTMSCKNFLCFPPNLTADFDVNNYNTMVTIRCVLENRIEELLYA
ncbi:uncharacterized protein LOC105835117 [Monomorium pharaonis]|uniref:uncharacterized protein LOC105835117 n=1 Tax=Monomorium pharaonis TaxID=307658 RepID=UPI00063F4A20|nr:uncharacterized protein LOC105835117 [Monomorium pharaonis]